MEKKKQNIEEQWSDFKRCNMHITGIPEGQKPENRAEELFDVIMAKGSQRNDRHQITHAGNS